MRRLLFTFLFVFLGLFKAYAMNIPTDAVSYANSDGRYFETGPGTGQNFSAWIALGQDGAAYRFILNDYYQVSTVQGFLTGVPRAFESQGPAGAQLFLYKGSNIDLSDGDTTPSHITVYQTGTLNIPINNTGAWYGGTNLDLTLAPGDYWIALEGHPGVGNQVNFSNYRLEGNVTTPEPATLLLLGGGLAGALWGRRKHNV